MLYILSIKKKNLYHSNENLWLHLLFIFYFKEIIFQLQDVKIFLVFLYYSQHNKHYGLTYICK